VGTQSITTYESSAGAAAVELLRELAAPLRGTRVLHISATPYGGGVAEILRSEIPLLRDLGLIADWHLISGDNDFFSVTKTIHNALQGADRGLSAADEQRYLAQSAQNAARLEEQYDVVVVHDPQPLALLELHDRGSSRWVWRCHIDTSEPNPAVWAFLRPFLVRYDAAVFTLGGFVPPDFPVSRVEIIPPAIDPQSPKNLELGSVLATRVLEWIGVDTSRPLIAQISRFDPWKDPLGVIAAYRQVREEVPDLQLALVGAMAADDPEGWEVYRRILSATRDDPDVHVFTNLTGVGNVEVNAFQRLAQVVIQKSIREGFGLVVSESLWKGTPVVAGRAGGIPLQLQDGHGGHLVDSVDECAQRTLELLADADARRRLGEQGHEWVRERFLLTRLLADELRLFASLLGTEVVPRHVVGGDGEHRDPVCGMWVSAGTARHLTYDHHDVYFCSRSCEDTFARDPERYRRATGWVTHPSWARRWLHKLRHDAP
jgi:trehalose synthase